MGRALPGFRTTILDPTGAEVPPGTVGDLAIDTAASPLYWFTGYYQAPDKTAERLPHGSRYYVTGDTAHTQPDGVFASAVRADDVINSSGYRIGPDDIEAVLRAHPEVAQAAVFGIPDPRRGELVAAALVLTDGAVASDTLVTELQDHVRARLGRHLYPRRFIFLDDLPRTASGKIQRRLLRELWQDQQPPHRPAADTAVRPSP